MFHRWHLTSSRELMLSGLVFCIGFALIDTVWSLYLDSFGLSESVIGFISSVLSVAAFVFWLFITPVLERASEKRLLVVTLFVHGLSFVIIAFVHSLWVFLLLSVPMTLFSALRIACFDISFRDNTPRRLLNREEGLLYSLLNAGWLIGPLFASLILFVFGIDAVFFAAGLFVISSAFGVLSIQLRNKVQKPHSLHIIRAVRDFFAAKLTLPYIMAAGVGVWWSFVYTYMPLFIIKHTSSVWVGVFITAVIFPLVLFERKVGALSFKKGFRYFFVRGFFWLCVLCLVCFFVHNIYVQMFLVVVGSFAIACVEPLQDTYFFKKVKASSEERFYPLYATATDVGSFISKLCIAGALFFLSEEFAFLIMALLFVLLLSFAKRVSPSDQ